MASRGPAQGSSSDLKAFNSVRLPPPQAPQAFVPIASSPAHISVPLTEIVLPVPNGSLTPISASFDKDNQLSFDSTLRKALTYEVGLDSLEFKFAP
jgi:hypothetical protein